jgi:hypothetical protein
MRRSQTPIYLSCPPETHISLFLKAISYTFSWPSSTVNGLITFEDKTEPNYRLTGAAYISNSYNLSEEAEINLGKDGVNLSA